MSGIRTRPETSWFAGQYQVAKIACRCKRGNALESETQSHAFEGVDRAITGLNSGGAVNKQ
jgi:hypothetical protein